MKLFRFLFIGIIVFSSIWAVSGAEAQTSQRKIVVVLDPGHGGKDPGKLRSSSKYKHEKDLNLIIAQKVGTYLTERTKTVKVIYTRTTDEYISLEERARIANDNKADYFISIHCDSNPNKHIAGMRAHIHSKGLPTSLELAERFVKEFSTRAGRITRGVRDAHERGYNLYVLQFTNMPGVLLEVGYMSNAAEERYLNGEYGQEIIASAIFRVIRDFVVEKHQKEHRETIYQVQLCASKTPLPKDHPDFKKINMPVSEVKSSNPQDKYKYKYTVGHEFEKSDIQRVLDQVRKAGFKDAFIIKIN